MEEFDTYHWLIQHPLRTYVASAILLVGLGLFIIAKITAHRDKRGSGPENPDGRIPRPLNKIPGGIKRA
ncbi:MAG: hypothetical protein ABJB34_07400 [Acidobacteriota bacterium]